MKRHTDYYGPDFYRDLTALDWLVSRKWNRLHFAELTDEQLEELEYESGITGPIRLACGRTAGAVSIPGLFTRMGAPRCIGCCAVVGYPPGKGSPKNDESCRPIVGMSDRGVTA